MAQPRTWEGMRTQITEQLVRQTGEDVDAWNAKLATHDLARSRRCAPGSRPKG
jgi:hypothetical protein